MNTKLKCLLLDDELPGLAYLKMLCEQIRELEVVRAYADPLLFLEEARTLEFDLCFLDIELPSINGIEVAKLLAGKQVIFTTAYRDYAADAFDLHAVDYIRKPVTIARLKEAVSRAVGSIGKNNQQKNYIRFNTNKGNALLCHDDFLYIRTSDTDSRDKEVWFENNTTITLKNIPFGKLMDLLPPGQFCRISKSEVIALKTIQFFSHSEIRTKITLPSGQLLALALNESYRAHFLEMVNTRT